MLRLASGVMMRFLSAARDGGVSSVGHVPYLRGLGKSQAVQKRKGSRRKVHRKEGPLRSHKIAWRCLGAHSSKGEFFMAHVFVARLVIG